MLDTDLLEFLEQNNAVLTGRHFVYTSGKHGTAYVNLRAVAHMAPQMRQLGRSIGAMFGLGEYGLDLVIGPETLGRTLASHAAEFTKSGEVIWCDMVGEGEFKQAVFPPKLVDFPKRVYRRRVGIVDDLLTTGSSIRAVASLVRLYGGDPVVAGAGLRRTPDVTAADCGVDNLEVFAEVEGFKTYTEEECVSYGPCAARVPVVPRPGHGHKWIIEHPDYPTD